MAYNYANEDMRSFRGEHKLVLVEPPGAQTRSRAKALLTIDECQAKYDKIYNTLGKNGETLSSFSMFANDFDSNLSVDEINQYLISAHNELREATMFRRSEQEVNPFRNSWGNNTLEFDNALDCAISLYINTYWKCSFAETRSILLAPTKGMGCRQKEKRALMEGTFAYKALQDRLGEKKTKLLFERIEESKLAISPFVSASESVKHATKYGSAQGKGGQYGRWVENGAFCVQPCRPVYNSNTGKLIENDDDDLAEFGFGVVKEFDITPNAIMTKDKEMHVNARIKYEQEVVYSGCAGTPIRNVALRVPALDEYDQNVHRDIYGLDKHEHEDFCRGILSGSGQAKSQKTETLIEITSTYLTKELSSSYDQSIRFLKLIQL